MFQAILDHVCDGQQEFCFDELIDAMIESAWYMVAEYHLNLGPKDTLEKTVNYIASITDMPSSVKRSEIRAWLEICSDANVAKFKRDLSLNVPYRLQAPFLESFDTESWKCGSRELSDRINKQKKLMYYFADFSGLRTKIRIGDEWAAYLKENQEILRGWIQFHMIQYLQRRNPSVPGISDKLYPPQERKLERVKKYWKLLSGITPIHEIYGDTLMTPDSVSIDHFVPWSYVAHDEFWNLHPTTRSINSSKSNNLPDWDTYFPRFAALEHLSYLMIWQNDAVHDEFIKCAKEHLNNPDIEQRLYRPGLTAGEFKGKLQEIVYPIYLSAKTCGFMNWEYAP